ncbi:MAG: YCF48-related protein [Chloroflexota bacterium]
MKILKQVSFLIIFLILLNACQTSNNSPKDSGATSTSATVTDQRSQNISRIVSSSDAGKSWQVLYQTNWLDLANIYCVENLTCYALSEEKSILKTTDGGTTWNKLGTEDMAVQSDSPFGCAKGGFCLLIESVTGGKVWVTYDGGNSWTKTGESPVDSPESIACPTSETCILVSRLGKVFDTQDGGKTWRQDLASNGITYKKITCLSESECFIVGMVFAGEFGLVVKTTDGGKSWSEAGKSPVHGLRAISCPTNNDCMSVGRFGIQNTHDGGQSWTELSGVAENGARSIGCSSPQNCFIIDGKGQMYLWNGLSLAKNNVDGAFTLRSVSCTSDAVCYAVGAFTDK